MFIKKISLRRLEMAAALAFLVSVCTAVAPFLHTCTQLENKVLRLHIVAHSDIPIDQDLKLQVRDLVLEKTSSLFRNAASRAEAESQLVLQLPELTSAAEQLLRTQGCPYRVNAALTDMYFPTRKYDSGTMPAGNYRALRLTIGSGQGQNWWCVMFPPLCLSSAAEPDVGSDLLTPDEWTLVRQPENFRVRLKIAEWWAQFRAWIAGI